MTPQEFVGTLVPSETMRRVAIVHALPLYSVSQWLSAVRQHAGFLYDRWGFRINPMRLHGYIDGMPEPRLAITAYDMFDRHVPAPLDGSDPGLIILRDITL